MDEMYKGSKASKIMLSDREKIVADEKANGK